MQKFFVIQEFMIKDLKLKGLERDLYAIIYGFTQDNQTKFSGSLKYMSEMTGYSKQAVVTALKKLIDKNMIGKEENEINGVKICNYFTIIGSKETLLGSKETLPNNNIYNSNILNNKLFNTITTEKPQKQNLYQKCIALVDDFCSKYSNDVELRDLLVNYLNFRLEVKEKPLYANMFKGMLNKLQDCLEKSIKGTAYRDIVQFSLERGYLSFYPITNKPQKQVENNIHWKSTYNLSESERDLSGERF